jgi:Flp pilus assembly protein TadG
MIGGLDLFSKPRPKETAGDGRRGKSGSAAIEFAFIAPILFTLIFGVIEVGCLFYAEFVLKNATIATARAIRTGNGSALTSTTALTSYICETDDNTYGKIAANLMLTNCTNKLKIYVKAFGTSFSSFSSSTFVSALKTSAVNADGTYNTNFDSNLTTACEIVLMRVSYAWNVFVPGLSWFLVTVPSTNQSMITATEIFRNEPASGSVVEC